MSISITENIDCMEFMARWPDKFFDLAIVDPPYGIDINAMNMGGRQTVLPSSKQWDSETPKPEYFKELFRVSELQIIWGGQLFPIASFSRIFCMGQR